MFLSLNPFTLKFFFIHIIDGIEHLSCKLEIELLFFIKLEVHFSLKYLQFKKLTNQKVTNRILTLLSIKS